MNAALITLSMTAAMLFKIIKSILLIYVTLLLMMYLLQRSMIYQPTPITQHPYTDWVISHDEGIVETILTRKNQQQAIIYFGGNAENVAYTASDFVQDFPQHSVYLMKYRGYGGAPGKPTESGLYADALALYDHLKAIHPEVVVIGRSLGSGVATYLASQRPVDKLVLVTPFDSLRSVAASLYPIFPVNWLLKDHHDSITRIAAIKAPTLIIGASEDRIIPPKHTEILAAAFPPNQLQIETIQAGHNDLDLNPEYFRTLKDFLNCHQQC